MRKIALVGNPNVGKSQIFNNLTGARATVSNYPGTTVTVYRGRMRIQDREFDVVDTPGMYSFFSITEEERLARSILLKEAPGIVLNIVDARNLGRMLVLTLQLCEAELPVILVLNMMDEARTSGMEIDVSSLRNRIGVPVVPTVATTKSGMDDLREQIYKYERRYDTYHEVS
ncbi:MAG: iron transporter [Spirochaetales bacterium]|nr:iron transporter [Spirochaetales bacterium]